jgi:hypothetical protein
MEETLRAYYSLCKIVANPPSHVVNVPKVRAVFSKREIELFFEEKDGLYHVREEVSGGADKWWRDRERHRAIVIG